MRGVEYFSANTEKHREIPSEPGRVRPPENYPGQLGAGHLVRKPLSRGINLIRPAAGFLLAWAFLNVLINLNYPAREFHRLAPLLLSPEILVYIAALCVAVRAGMPFRRAIYLPLTGFILFVRAFRLGDVLIPMYLNRTFNLYIDSQYIPDLIHLLYHTVSLEAFIGYTVLAVMLFAGVTWGVWQALKTIHRFAASGRQRHGFLGLSALLLGLFLILPYPSEGEHPRLFAQGFSQRLVKEIDFILHVRGYRTENLSAIRAATARASQTPSALNSLRRENVYLFFIESYGRTVFADPSHFSMAAPLLKAFEQGLKANGFDVYSHFLTSPTYGGASWLAHGTLASGIPLNRQTQYDLLITSKLKTLAHYFDNAGYRTVSVMPGITLPWPEGQFFGYQKKYYARHFDYRGPKYGWAPMPDQYVLDFIYRHEIQKRTTPLFVEHILVSSHAPFHRQPSYLADWSQIKNGAIFHKRKPIIFPIVWPDLTDAGEAYITSIGYVFKVLTGYFEQFIDDGALIIILGDHQPNAQITGTDRSWSVPIHVISRTPAFLKPFEARGYIPGIIPTQPPPHPGMETFLYHFLEDFSTETTTVQTRRQPP
jgi:hypothetical protein